MIGCRALLVAALLANALALAACQNPSSTSQRRSDAVASSAAPEGPSLYTHAALSDAMSAIRSRVGDAEVLSLEVCPAHATIQVQLSSDRHRVVQYEWKGGRLFGPEPVQLRGKGSLEANVFPLSTIDLAGVPELVTAAIERIDPANGKVERILVRRNLPADQAVGMRVYVASPIRDGHVDADARGRLVEAGKAERSERSAL